MPSSKQHVDVTYYYFKSWQAFATILILMLILCTGKLVVEYEGNMCSAQLSNDAAKCNNLFIFNIRIEHINFMDSIDPIELHEIRYPGVSSTKYALLPSRSVCKLGANVFPTGPASLNISLSSTFDRAFIKGSNPIDLFSDQFAMPILFAFFYLILVVMHAFLKSESEYGFCEYIVVELGVIIWAFIFYKMFILCYEWNQYWMCSNLRPTFPFVVVVFVAVLSNFLLISCIFEIAYDMCLLMEPASNESRNPPEFKTSRSSSELSITAEYNVNNQSADNQNNVVAIHQNNNGNVNINNCECLPPRPATALSMSSITVPTNSNQNIVVEIANNQDVEIAICRENIIAINQNVRIDNNDECHLPPRSSTALSMSSTMVQNNSEFFVITLQD